MLNVISAVCITFILLSIAGAYYADKIIDRRR